MYRRLLQPADQPVVAADRLVGQRPVRAPLHPAVLYRPRRLVRRAELVQQGGGCYILRLRLRRWRSSIQGALSKSARTWLVGADIGWNPVTNLNFDLELMYQSTNQDRPSGFLGHHHPMSAASAAHISSRATGTALRAASLAASASPVTSDRNPIGRDKGPGAKAPGFLCVNGEFVMTFARIRSAWGRRLVFQPAFGRSARVTGRSPMQGLFDRGKQNPLHLRVERGRTARGGPWPMAVGLSSTTSRTPLSWPDSRRRSVVELNPVRKPAETQSGRGDRIPKGPSLQSE